MSRRRGIMSDAMKFELARELGVLETVQHDGWGEVSSRNCGNLVRLAIEKAESLMAQSEYNPNS